MKQFRSLWLFATLAIFFLSRAAISGPPFLTDDPEPVEYHCWEIYLASMVSHDADETGGTLPHADINYGIAPDMQVNVVLPYQFQRVPGTPTTRGYGDSGFGFKYRFMPETEQLPMVSVYPSVSIPTGDEKRDLGTGHLQFFLPVWAQKSWGTWTSYGGGGFHLNPGTGNKNFWNAGWEVQRDFGRKVTLGGELFYSSASSQDGEEQLDWNIGGQFNLSDIHHLLFSAGRNFRDNDSYQYYIAYQLTFGE